MKYLIIFILVCNFSVNAMTIECLLEETPDERIYLDINFDNKMIYGAFLVLWTFYGVFYH